MTDEPTDIVEYLRRNAVFNYKDTYIAAADEIERLRNKRDQLVRIINKLTAQRDAARQEVCVLMQQTGFLRGDYAIERGWDCFKEKP